MSKYIIVTSGRTGSSVLIESLKKVSYRIASEPLNQAYNFHEKYLPCPKEEVLSLSNEDKLDVIHKVMQDHDLCKILYYQVNFEIISELANHYKIISLLRCPFDVTISAKVAEIRGRWHNTGQFREKPEQKLYVPETELLNLISLQVFNITRCLPISERVFYYDDILHRWDYVIEAFGKLLNNDKFKNISPFFRKNPENPEDYISNYHDLRQMYNEKFLRIFTPKFI